MRRTPLKKIGRIGKANLEARKRIAIIAEERGLNYCEIGLTGCLSSWPLAPAHRHKRGWYKGNVILLSNFDQWVVGCQHCHSIIENDAYLAEEVFERLRPKTSLV